MLVVEGVVRLESFDLRGCAGRVSLEMQPQREKEWGEGKARPQGGNPSTFDQMSGGTVCEAGPTLGKQHSTTNRDCVFQGAFRVHDVSLDYRIRRFELPKLGVAGFTKQVFCDCGQCLRKGLIS